MTKQICKDCQGHGVIYPDLGYYEAMHLSLSDCPTCNGCGRVERSGPYKLLDGTWSDGVDRKLRICDQSGYDCDRNRIFVWRYHDRYRKMRHVWVVDRQEPWVDEEFDSWEEAIEYATKKGLQ